MKIIKISGLIITLILFIVFLYLYFYRTTGFPPDSILCLLGKSIKSAPKPLDIYELENLSAINIAGSDIRFIGPVEINESYMVQKFVYKVPARPDERAILNVSGLAHFPKTTGLYPIILMLRGYVPPEFYQSGIGTRKAAEVYAKNGFITLAPDFLGFGESASPSADPFESRFQTYTTALALLNSVDSINSALQDINRKDIEFDGQIGIWGHSNGGHIALTILAITGKNYPTVLWAPVSKPFPYSILYYSDEFDDYGKKIRSLLSDFEKHYDANTFSFTNYLENINAPVAVYQGKSDEEVPYWWSDEFVAKLKDLKKLVEYNKYSNADHNLIPGGWQRAVNDSIDFYESNLLH